MVRDKSEGCIDQERFELTNGPDDAETFEFDSGVVLFGLIELTTDECYGVFFTILDLR